MRNLFFLILILGFNSPLSVYGIERAERDAVVIVELSTHVVPDKRWFYEKIETFAVAESRLRLTGAYRNVTFLEKEKASLASLRETLGTMAKDSQLKAVDLYVHLHGWTDILTFHEGNYSVVEVSEKLREVKELEGRLRAVYSAACFGASHLEAWRRAGARVAAGARGINTNSAFDYPTFLKAWGGGRTFGEAQERANHPFWRKFYDDLSARLGFGAGDSYKIVDGAAELTIESPAR